ncbi:hypothetical protein FVEG_17447 [Fusarium verticillioides 7600]|uniref:Uncharacterized protein n=1 Tax=Gibberella moniliformis (strain M3125 / FGSC 7600) TaxID=334819 RepID=W7NFH9_GIBM7|nr:hypothetical protein FVEG_17447 [Fusarium verticillioides 7600]EWG55037.1 hypothetical protein FVEG_17447 [Fusarium verticillioides 7600]
MAWMVVKRPARRVYPPYHPFRLLNRWWLINIRRSGGRPHSEGSPMRAALECERTISSGKGASESGGWSQDAHEACPVKRHPSHIALLPYYHISFDRFGLRQYSGRFCA